MKQLNKKSILRGTTLGASLLALASTAVQAQITNPAVGPLGDDDTAAKTGTTFVEYFIALWSAVIMAGGIAVLIIFIWGAVDWLTSGGDSSKLEKARNKMLHAALGITILVGSYTIVSFLSWLLFGDAFSILNLTIPDPGDLL